MIILQNILNENIVNPFRSGKVSIKIGTTTYKNLNHDFIMLDNMEWLFKLKPSFVILLPKNSDITKKNSKLNVEIIYQSNTVRPLPSGRRGYKVCCG